MDFTSRMTALLREMRRERNGAVADAMRYYGAAYGLNYGVSLPTLRKIARAEPPDHDFARYLYLQDVRELRLAALHIAQPERFTAAEFPAWAAGIVNSEVAEEAAFALLSRSAALPELLLVWISSSDPLLQYAALLAAARSPHPAAAWIAPALDAVHRNALAERHAASTANSASGGVFPSPATTPDAVAGMSENASGSVSVARDVPSSTAGDTVGDIAEDIAGDTAGYPVANAIPMPVIPAPYAARLTAQGAVALLAAIGAQNEENRQAVLRATGSPGKLPAEDYVHEELAWRLEA